MHRAYDPGETIREKGLNAAARLNSRISHDSKREMENGVSRSSLVHGTQTNPNSDTWYDTDAFLLDQVKEVLNKLNEGSIDDEIWGKIVIMERCKRVAKAYLRKTTVIIDGSEDEFDGKTLGFNHFENPTRDDHTKEIRAKIADGVILKMDYQGNIKGMARGATPIVCQGWKEPRNNCISDRLVRLHGKLNHGAMEDEKAYKVFDMRKFKHSLERELHDGTPDARNLLLKTCMRVALVKDGADMNRTPCWFAIVNLVALDMIKEKIPLIKSLLNVYGLPSVTSPSPMSGPDNSGFNAQTLTQIIAAAVTQANKGTPTPTRNNNNNNQNLTISPEQLAQIASTISIAQTNTLRTADLVKKERPKKPYHCSTSSLDSSGEDSSGRRSEASTAIKSRAKRWEQVQKINEIEKYTESPAVQMLDKPRAGGRAHRPLLQDVIFTRSHSITSDYDSNKEHFDSGSWSSTQSRYKDGRSTSSSVVSEHELAALARDELKETSEIREANAVSEDDEPPTNPPSPAPTVNVPTLPRKDYNQSPAHTPEHVCPLPRSFSSTPAAEQFLPTLEGAPVWTPSAVSTASELSPPIPMSSPPPPLPRTPQPNNGLPNASLPYNQINNAGSFTRTAARRWKFTSVEARSSPILHATDQTRSSANSVRFSRNERADCALRATTLNQPQFIPTCDNSATLANPTTVLPNRTTTSAAIAAAGGTLQNEPIHNTSRLLLTKRLEDSGERTTNNTNTNQHETNNSHQQHNAYHHTTTANLLCVANQHQ
ncbi:MH2 domain-containing protein [Caenorhabditis elegans]|uniref:MH2 domain-containing protein n=3 Tax=Caenorhabditis elegans TaxID=6239 RepID=E0AHB1_CAEEL|nr:MH2 domain-containing protein [Caenorhabditis elegans]CBW44363.2 MH2 domain-containing protein [Caenorhabditis elegans]